MARRSLLLSKKRSSRATISKKRKLDRELQQPYSPKRKRGSGFQDDEEEIGDFIVVDTGTLNYPEETNQGSTIAEEDDVSTSCTPNAQEAALEYKEVAAKTRPHLSIIDSDTAKQARDALLVLDSTSTETVEGKRSRAQSLEISETHLPSVSKDNSVAASPLLKAVNETSQSRDICPGPTSDKIASSLSSPLALGFEENAKPPQLSKKMRTESQPPYRSISPASVASAEIPLDTLLTHRHLDDSSTQPIIQQVESVSVQVLASEKNSNATLGVLVTKGDQCPSKFVVSGIAANSEPVMSKIDSQVRTGVPWIETVTEARAHVLPEIPESREGLRHCDIHGLSISRVLQDAPESPRQNLAKSTGVTERPTGLISFSDALQLPQQSSRSHGPGPSNVRQGSTELLKQLVPDQQRPTSGFFQENEKDIAGDTESKRLQPSIQHPRISPQATAFVGSNPLGATTEETVGPWWTTKLSCLDISPLPNSNSIPPNVGSRPPMISPGNSPPSLRFTIDNRAESTLTTMEVQRLVQTFVRDAVAIVPRQQSTQAKYYPAGVIMWQSLQKFCKWYSNEERRENGERLTTTVMKFELLDVHWQPENVFLIPKKNNLDQFRALKQCIWDLFWVASNLNGAPATFRILVTRAPEMDNQANFGHLMAGDFNAPSQLLEVISSPSSTNFASVNPVGVESPQGPEPTSAQHQHRLSVVRPPPLVTLAVEVEKTPQVRGFIQENRSHDANRLPSIQPFPMRTESAESSTLRTNLLHPPLIPPGKTVTTTSQPHTIGPSASTSALNDNLGVQYHFFAPYHFGTHRNPPSSSQTHTFPLQNSHDGSAVQIPLPSPVTTDASKVETSHANMASSGKNYAANTARPLFAMPPQKDGNPFRSLLPPNQPYRVVNTARPVPDPQPAQVPPSPTTDKEKGVQREIAPPVPHAWRTPGNKMKLRDKALQMIARRRDVELEDDETIGGEKRTYPEISGVIVDKNSAMGIVVITERGYPVQQVDTGQDLYVDQYTELTLRDGQACVIHGNSAVLYYKPRKPSVQSQSSRSPRKPLPSQPPQTTDVPKTRRTSPYQAFEKQVDADLNPKQFTTEITIRLQIDPVGHFSAPYDLSVFRSEISNRDFFKWFKLQTNHGDSERPSTLRFTLKDAMPVAKVDDVARGDEEGFRRIREDILVQFEKARMFMPRLREFGVLVVDPAWRDLSGK